MKLLWFIKRFGWSQLFMKPLRRLAAPALVPLYRGGYFMFEGRSYEYLSHPYNTTWANERCVEVPVIYDLVQRERGRVLEVGNVLSHYYPVTHRVIDKYEGPEKLDVVDVTGQYDLIVSISTFEHIGFDEGQHCDKLDRAIAACRNALAPGGRLIFTIPTGYNPAADAAVYFFAPRCLTRTKFRTWIETWFNPSIRYGSPYPFANQVAFVTVS